VKGDKVARRILALLLVLGMGVPAQFASGQSVEADLSTGIRQVREGDFDAALLTLDSVVKRLSAQPGPTKDLARAYTYLAIAYVGLAQQETAKSKFLEAWKADRTMTLSPKEFPPNIIQFFEDTKKESQERAKTERTTTPSAGPAPSPAATTQTAEKKGGGHTGLILLGVGGVAAAGIAIAAAGKGGSSTSTLVPSVPSAVIHVNIDPNPITAVSSGDASFPWDFRFNLEIFDSGGVGFTITQIETVVASATSGIVINRSVDTASAGTHYPALGRVVRQYHNGPYRMENFTRQGKVTVNYNIVDDNGHHFDGSTNANVLYNGEVLIQR
jgi:hypothetical protein